MEKRKRVEKILLRHLLSVAVGMFVFGFIDNFILVIAGDAIDKTLAHVFGFSTMFAAGIGNTISDAVGVLFGSVIAAFVYRMFGEVKKEEVGPAVFIAAETTGVILGCLAGLIPLAFI